MTEMLWIVAALAILVSGFFSMGKLDEYMDNNRKDRDDISRQKHRG